VPIFETRHQRAQLLIGLLGIGLVIALWPYVTGLIGGPVLFVIFAPFHRWLSKRMPAHVSAALVVAVAVFALVVPGLSVAGLVVNEAQQLAGDLLQSPIFGQLSELQVGDFQLGPRLVGLGERIVTWVGQSAFDLIETATKLALNVTIAMFTLYFLLVYPGQAWQNVSPYIPFSPENSEKLRRRFRDVTNSTLIGTGLTAIIQGVLVGSAFALAGLPRAILWGTVTAVFAILPVVGSGLVWGPGAVALFLNERYGAAVAIFIWGLIIVASVDNLIRPFVYNRWARIHPLVTLVGALAGIRFFGILGLLIGPLALSYFFELIRMYKAEYIAREPDDLEPILLANADTAPEEPGPRHPEGSPTG
jgi:predicted PurR-regulated permease PerM